VAACVGCMASAGGQIGKGGDRPIPVFLSADEQRDHGMAPRSSTQPTRRERRASRLTTGVLCGGFTEASLLVAGCSDAVPNRPHCSHGSKNLAREVDKAIGGHFEEPSWRGS
jgi:hypothetical protein